MQVKTGNYNDTALKGRKSTISKDKKMSRYTLVVEIIGHSDRVVVKVKERHDSRMTPSFLI